MLLVLFVFSIFSLMLAQYDWQDNGVPVRQGIHIEWQRTGDNGDVGEMILLFRNHVVPAGTIHRPASKDLQLPIVGIIPKGPVHKMTPILTVSGSTQKIPLVRNLISIGSSNSNDIIVEGDEVALRHAKIYKVGASWKIQNLLIQETTTVNGRRIDQRFLQDGDEVTVGDIMFKFKSGKAQIKQTLK